MGVFHYRCAVTGLSLNGAECVAIWVAEVEPDRWVPASLPIRGSYNAYGTIDMIHRYTPQAWHTERVRKWFKVAEMTGKIVLRGDAKLACERKGVDDHFLAGPLEIIERATTCRPGASATFGGQRIEQVLLLASVYDAIVAHGPVADEADAATVVPCAFGAWLYQTITDGERERARRSFAEMRALEQVHTDWTPEHDPGQLGADEFVSDYLAARGKFHDRPWLLAVIDAYVADKERLYGRKLPARWLLDWGRSWYGAIIGDARFVATSKAELVEQIDKELAYASDETLLDEPLLAFAVIGDKPQPELDLRRWITVSLGSAKATLDQRDATEEILTSPGEPRFDVALDPRALETFPELSAPLLRKGSEAIYFVGEAPPAWVHPEDRYEAAVSFGRYTGSEA